MLGRQSAIAVFRSFSNCTKMVSKLSSRWIVFEIWNGTSSKLEISSSFYVINRVTKLWLPILLNFFVNFNDLSSPTTWKLPVSNGDSIPLNPIVTPPSLINFVLFKVSRKSVSGNPNIFLAPGFKYLILSFFSMIIKPSTCESLIKVSISLPCSNAVHMHTLDTYATLKINSI